MDESVLVLMATYNGEKYLREQLESIFAQKNVSVSVLVRDDGSQDGTIDILKEYHTKSKLDWYTGEHLNVKLGFLDLMKKAEDYGVSYFAFCDQDDVWNFDKLSNAVTMLEEKNKDVPNLYYAGQTLVDENMDVLGVHQLNADRNMNARFIFNDAAGCTCVFNAELLRKVNEYTPQYILMHDAWVVKVCLALGGNLIVDPKPCMCYRQHGNNVVGLKNDIFSKIKRAKQYIKEQDVSAQMRELKQGYASEIVQEYQELIESILNYRKSVKTRLRLMKKSNVDFADKGLQITFFLKIFLNKL